MSLTSKQIDELRAYAANRKGELAKLINDAADTIELLSAKLSASNMERSSQYYHGGWIPVTERLPEQKGTYPVWTAKGFGDHLSASYWDGEGWTLRVIAWMPLPEPYREEGEEEEVNEKNNN